MGTRDDRDVPRRGFLSRQLIDAPGGFWRGFSIFTLCACVLLGVGGGVQQHADTAFLNGAQARSAHVVGVHRHSSGNGEYLELDVLLTQPGVPLAVGDAVRSRLHLDPGDQTRTFGQQRVIPVLVDPAHPATSRLAADPTSGTGFLIAMSVVFGLLCPTAATVAVVLARGQPGWQARDGESWRRADRGSSSAPEAEPWSGPGQRMSVLLPNRKRRASLALGAGGTALLFLAIGVIGGNGSLPWFAVLAGLCLLVAWRAVCYRAVIEADGKLLVGVRPFGRRVALSRAMVRVPRRTQRRTAAGSGPDTTVTLELGVPAGRPVMLVLATRTASTVRLFADPAGLSTLGAGLASSASPGAREAGAMLRRVSGGQHQDQQAWQELSALRG